MAKRGRKSTQTMEQQVWDRIEACGPQTGVGLSEYFGWSYFRTSATLGRLMAGGRIMHVGPKTRGHYILSGDRPVDYRGCAVGSVLALSTKWKGHRKQKGEPARKIHASPLAQALEWTA